MKTLPCIIDDRENPLEEEGFRGSRSQICLVVNIETEVDEAMLYKLEQAECKAIQFI